MTRENRRLNRTLLWPILTATALIVTLGLAGDSVAAKGGNGGGGKPPKDDNPLPVDLNPVFVYGVADSIYVAELAADASGLGRREFVTTGWAPSWSPDGKEILFVADDGFLNRMPLFDENGEFSPGGPISLGVQGAVYGDSVWSSEGWIAYLTPEGYLEVANDEDGSNATPIAYPPNLSSSGPALSPDDTTVAYGLNPDTIAIRKVTVTEGGFAAVYVANITGLTRLMDMDPTEGLYFELGWSNTIDEFHPEGRLLVKNGYNACPECTVDIGNVGHGVWILDPTDDPPSEFSDINWLVLTDGGTGLDRPSWSPDDAEIIYGYTYWRRSFVDPCTQDIPKGRDSLIHSVVKIRADIADPVSHPTSCDQVFMTDEGSTPRWWRGPVCGNNVEERGEDCNACPSSEC